MREALREEVGRAREDALREGVERVEALRELREDREAREDPLAGIVRTAREDDLREDDLREDVRDRRPPSSESDNALGSILKKQRKVAELCVSTVWFG